MTPLEWIKMRQQLSPHPETFTIEVEFERGPGIELVRFGELRGKLARIHLHGNDHPARVVSVTEGRGAHPTVTFQVYP